MGVGGVADTGEHVRKTAHLGGVGVQVLDRVGNSRICIERVAARHFASFQPVHPPHVLTPADHLADEPLYRGDRRRSLDVFGLGRLGALERAEQTEIERAPDQGVPHESLTLDHCVLVGTELRQSLFAERGKRTLCLGASGRKEARAV